MSKIAFIGEIHVESLAATPFREFRSTEWALQFIAQYGGIDGAHHKDWILDQVARILLGTPVMVSLAQWANGHQEYRFRTGQPSSAYAAWVKKLHDYDEGIAP